MLKNPIILTGHISHKISVICGECGKIFDNKEECNVHMESYQDNSVNIDTGQNGRFLSPQS